MLHLTPGVLRGRRPGRGGRAAPPAPRRAAKFGGGPAPAGPGCEVGREAAAGPPQPGMRCPPGAADGGDAPGDGHPASDRGRERKGSWQAVGESQPNFDLRHPVLMPEPRTSLAALVPEKKEGESRN